LNIDPGRIHLADAQISEIEESVSYFGPIAISARLRGDVWVGVVFFEGDNDWSLCCGHAASCCIAL
jgi:hypothetical protein